MMAWSEAQKRRFAQEEEILNEYFPRQVKWFNRESKSMRVEITMTTNSEKSYTLRVCVPEDYPNSCPNLYVCNPPRPLKTKDGNEIDCGTDFHSYGTNDGLTKICHFVPSQWTNEYTLYQVFMKGRIWLEAYEIHLRTGKRMADYLREMTTPDDILAVLHQILNAAQAAKELNDTSTSEYRDLSQREQMAQETRSQSKKTCLIQ